MPSVNQSIQCFFDYSSEPLPAAFINFKEWESENVIFKVGQRYNLGLELLVPDSDLNINQGNFMVTLELLNAKNQTLALVSKPAHLIYKSPLLRTLTTLFYSPALLLGSMKESSTTSLNLLSNYIEKKSTESIQFAKITLGNRLIQTYSTNILIETHFQGLAYFMHHWWFSTAFFFISNIMLMEVLIVSLVWTVATAENDSSETGKVEQVVTEESTRQTTTDQEVLQEGDQEVFQEGDQEEAFEKRSIASVEQDNETLDGESMTEKSLYHHAEEDHVHIEPQILSGMLRGSNGHVMYPVSRIHHQSNRSSITQSGNFSYPYSRSAFTNTKNDSLTSDVPPAVVELSRALSPTINSAFSSTSTPPSSSSSSEKESSVKHEESEESIVPDSAMLETTMTGPEMEEFDLSVSTIPNQLGEESTVNHGDDEFDMSGLLGKDDDLVLQ